MKIIDLINNIQFISQGVLLLQSNFKCYEKEAAALEEMNELLEEKRICLGLILGDELVGMIGGIPTYSGNVWELHPLVIKKKHQRKGYGSILIKAFEEEVKKRKGMTIYLGTDDEYNQTSLSNVDIYDNLYDRLKNIQNTNHHLFTFYQKNGYMIVGVMPDASGYGKPDILMAKRVGEIKDETIR